MMKRRAFVKMAGISAFAVSASGFNLIQKDGITSTDCATSTDMLGPFFREGAPSRNDITYQSEIEQLPIKVVGKVFGADCNLPLKNLEIEVWHCDHKKNYDMESDEFRCRGKIQTDQNGAYWFKTFMPAPYGGRPKHIHYLIREVEGYQELATQLYFKGDKRIKQNNWVKYPWDEKRILEIYRNEEEMAEVNLDLYLTPKSLLENK